VEGQLAMMWLVLVALRRPLSVAVMALLMLVLGVLSFANMNTDIFPAINLPVVMMVWNYPGLSPYDMEQRMVTISERALSTTVNAIEHMESESLLGIGIVKIYFQPNADLGSSMAQVSAVANQILHQLPRGTEPPQIIYYNASNVPVAQLNLYSDVLSGQQLYDYGFNFVRLALFTIPGFSSPQPLGGVPRNVMVNLDQEALYGNRLSPQDIGSALSLTNPVIPSGTVRVGGHTYDVDINMSPQTVAEFNQLPVKVANGAPVLLGQVAPVSDTHQPQTDIVQVNGRPATYLLVIKQAAASTITVVDQVKARLPGIMAVAPKGLKIALTFDQSVFVKAALWDVLEEALTAAALVAIMVLIFVGSARSMLIVITSIPLAILTSIIALNLFGQTINTMTLGGLALAVGMLVDDATVEVENIHRNHTPGKPLVTAILEGAHQIATPTLVGTLSICVVFFPVVLLSGVARYLFPPLALTVVAAMLTSYLLSRTLVPAMANHLLPNFAETAPPSGLFGRFLAEFEHGFDRVRNAYSRALAAFIARRQLALTSVAVMIVGSVPLFWVVGQDFFPSVDTGLMRLHIRAPTGTRIESTSYLVAEIDRDIRDVIPADQLESISDNVGAPQSFVLAYYPTDSVGDQDADIMIELQPKHRPTAFYEKAIRARLANDFPSVEAYFQAADIVSQVLTFGLSAPIDAQVSGPNLGADYMLASRLQSAMQRIPGIADLRIAEPLNYPSFKVDVDRAKALELGLTESDVASSLLTSTSGNSLLAPSFWVDPKTGVNYSVIAQTPQHSLNSTDAISNIPIRSLSAAPSAESPQLLGNLARISRSADPAVIDHYTVQRVIDVNAGVSGRDLGSVTSDVEKAIASLGKLPPEQRIVIRGESKAMRNSFIALGAGLVLAVVLVYLLMVANFQSWLEPFIITMAIPGALAGVLWTLIATGTTINVESLMGTIMAVGVGVSNGNLLITFANELREEGKEFSDAVSAAIEAGHIRFRPIIMTALAMILGMLPMALGLGAGGEQNAPLGRAVIGGLLFATVMTLFVVPAVYSIFSREFVGKNERDERIMKLAPKSVLGE
jgi:multidrug efflux pump subunit AcrB